MIALITDFGLDGLYVGQMHACLVGVNPGVQIIDLCHMVPAHNICSAAYLIPAYTHYLPTASIIICVIDPGVGGSRPHAVCQADDRWFIGPDNGIFDVLQQRSKKFIKHHFLWPGDVSSSFHGRDVYAPAACQLARSDSLVELETVRAETERLRYNPDLNEIIYFDHFGNALTGLRFSRLPKDTTLTINGHALLQAGTFSEVEKGDCFCYQNANGLVEIACNQGSARDQLSLSLGDSFSID